MQDNISKLVKIFEEIVGKNTYGGKTISFGEKDYTSSKIYAQLEERTPLGLLLADTLTKLTIELLFKIDKKIEPTPGNHEFKGLKILQLESWMRMDPDWEEDNFKDLTEIIPIIGRDGYYHQRKPIPKTWFEVQGKAYKYDYSRFKYSLALLDFKRLTSTEIQSIDALIKIDPKRYSNYNVDLHYEAQLRGHRTIKFDTFKSFYTRPNLIQISVDKFKCAITGMVYRPIQRKTSDTIKMQCASKLNEYAVSTFYIKNIKFRVDGKLMLSKKIAKTQR